MAVWLNNFLAAGTVVLLVGLLVIIASFLFPELATLSRFRRMLSEHASAVCFALAVGAMAGSLIYSDYLGYEPCILCWWQRIFIYPQVLLYGRALIKKDKSVFSYGALLSGFAFALALYNTYLQYGGSPLLNCGVGTVSCTVRYVYTWGFITLPLMSLAVCGVLWGTAAIAERDRDEPEKVRAST